MEKQKHYTAIVLAAGSGRRMQSDIPKQFMELCGHPLLYYSLRAFEQSAVDDIVLVTGKDDISYCREKIVEAYGFQKVRAVIPGGKERYLSVYEGLKAAEGSDYVLIHDGARPLIDEMEIRLSMREVEEEHACVIGVPVKDTIKVGNLKNYATDTPDRSSLWAIQTPQSFSYTLLMEAYDKMWKTAGAEAAITDDAMIVERFTGHPVKLVRGKYENIKVTTPEDLLIAEVFLKKAKKMKNCY